MHFILLTSNRLAARQQNASASATYNATFEFKQIFKQLLKLKQIFKQNLSRFQGGRNSRDVNGNFRYLVSKYSGTRTVLVP
jgi:hypothetical protein